MMPTPFFGFGQPQSQSASPAMGANGRGGGLNPQASQGYNPLGNSSLPSGMPAINGPQMNTGYTPNPYMGQQLNAIQTQYNNNLTQNTLPAIQSGAVAAGGLGGSRQGVAQGLAIGQSQRGFADAASNLLGQDYEAQQGRNLQQYQGDQQYGLGMGNLALGYQNANNQMQLGQANIGLGYAGLQNQANIAQGQLGLGYTNAANQRYATDQGTSTQRYGIDSQTGLGYAGLNNQMGIAQMNNATTQRGQDQNYSLGQGANQNQANQIANNYTLGQGNLNLGYQNSAQQYNLGLGQNYNQATANNNSYNLGLQQNATTQRGQDANYNLGMTQAAYGRENADHNYNLGLGQLDLNGMQLGANLYNQGVNGAWNPINNANNVYGNYTGFGNSSSTASQGGGAMGAFGGALGGAQLANLFSNGSSSGFRF